jgi:phenylacetate-CoA ligase
MPSLPDYVVLDPDVERLPIDRLRALQSERLRAMVRYAYDATPFWKRKLDAAGVHPSDVSGLDDLPRLPFCTKQELQEDQAAHPPFGSYVGSDPARLAKFVTTSGTTGRPLKRVFSARDWKYAVEKLLRRPRVGPGDITVSLGPVDGLMGPSASAEAAMRAGALVVPAALHDSRSKIALLQDLRPAQVSGTASYLLYLVDLARELGVDLRTLGIRSVVSSGEPGAALLATRRRLAEGWGAAIGDGYGMTELFPLGGGCKHSTALHIASDLVITEIVDPETGAPQPVGAPGEVVYTNIVGDTHPLLRYRTRDIARLCDEPACACGFTGARLRNSIEGRVDDMIWFHGVNVFPSAVEVVLRSFPELGHEYEILVETEHGLPKLTVRAETRADVADDVRAGLDERVRNALAGAIRVRAHLELLPEGTLRPTATPGKRRRVVRRQ